MYSEHTPKNVKQLKKFIEVSETIIVMAGNLGQIPISKTNAINIAERITERDLLCVYYRPAIKTLVLN